MVPYTYLTIQQTDSYQLYDYIFDKDKNAFKKELIYDAGEISFLTNSQK